MDFNSMTDMDVIIFLAKRYLAGSGDPNDLNQIKDEDLSPDSYLTEIAWFQVGRNSSHDFYLGLKDNQLYKRSVTDEEPENGPQILVEQITQITKDKIGYIGHW